MIVCGRRSIPTQAVECTGKGRHPAFVFDFARGKLAELLQMALGWDASTFLNDIELWRDCVSCIQYTHNLAMKAIAEYDMIPRLVARLGQPVIRDR